MRQGLCARSTFEWARLSQFDLVADVPPRKPGRDQGHGTQTMHSSGGLRANSGLKQERGKLLPCSRTFRLMPYMSG